MPATCGTSAHDDDSVVIEKIGLLAVRWRYVLSKMVGILIGFYE